MDKALALDEIIRSRRSVRIFEKNQEVENEAVLKSIERATLSANSSNLQLWEFHRIKSEGLLKEFIPFCLNQNAAKTASELLVVVVRKDLWKKRRDQLMMEIKPENAKRLKAYKWYYGSIVPLLYASEPTHLFSLSKKLAAFVIGIFRPIAREVSQTDMRIVAHKSAALAAQTFMLSMKAEGYDTCPMEGMDSKRIKNALKLPAKAEISMVIGMGKGMEKGIYGPRWRLPMTDVVFEH